MVGAVAERLEAANQRGHPFRRRQVPRIPKDAQQGTFGDRACRPASAPVIGKPIMRDFVMGVILIEQCNQNVRVEQRGAVQSSSRSSFTSFMVGMGLPGGLRGRSGTPFRTST